MHDRSYLSLQHDVLIQYAGYRRTRADETVDDTAKRVYYVCQDFGQNV